MIGLSIFVAVFGLALLCADWLVGRMEHHDDIARRRLEQAALGRAAQRCRDGQG